MSQKFNYTYSAAEAEEIKEIRKKYISEEEPKTAFEQIKELDKKAEHPGAVLALSMGIIGTLILGAGMSLIMVWGNTRFILGVIIGIVGIVLAASAYPVYHAVTEKQRKRIAPLILKLTENTDK